MASRTFKYTAMDASGTPRSGMLQAIDEPSARSELTRQGYLVESIVENLATQTAPEPLRVDKRGVPIEALQTFFSQLGSMNKSGVPLIQSLATLHDSNTHPALKSAIADMKEGAQSGIPLSDAMQKYPQVFGPLLIALVMAGEKAGTLEKSLAQISGYLMRELKLRNQVRAATFWPKLTLIAILAIPLVANLVIDVFGRAGSVTLVNFLTKPWFLIPFVLLILLWLVFFRFINIIPSWRMAWDRVVLSLPYAGPTSTMLAMSKFTRALGALYSAGVPMPETVRLSANACGNTYLAAQIAPAAGKVEMGQGITQALRETGALTPVALDMVNTGEVTGSMEAVLDNVADQYESEAEVRQEKMLRGMLLTWIIFAAILVLTIAVNFYTGYFNSLMNQADG